MLPMGGFLTVSSAGTHCSGPHLVYGFLTTELSARPILPTERRLI
jgi:hypothetical protein